MTISTRSIEPAGRVRSRLRILALEVMVPAVAAVVVWVGAEAGLQSQWMVEFIDMHRPAFEGASTRVHVEKQVWHLHALARSPQPRIAVAGSSSVANGIDPALVAEGLGEGAATVANLGVTGMLAYELPLLADVILTPGTGTVVYLYNQFSFADTLHPDAIDIRWNTIEMLGLAPPSLLDTTEVGAWFGRAASEVSWLLRFRTLLRHVTDAWLHGRLQTLAHPYDYPPDEPAPPARRPRDLVTPVASDNWLRRAYLESTAGGDTLGYRGLRRFCVLARRAGARLVVAPVPEPGFLESGRYAQGSDRRTVDGRVRALAESCGAVYIPRGRFADIEADDGLFRDELHLHRVGRDAYSRLLGRVLAEGR